jgi:predicted ATPase/class 3 adenylate cyclase
VGDVRAWLEANGFARLSDIFEENEIDGEALLELTEEHLKDFGIALGPRLKLLKAIQSLRREADEKPPYRGPLRSQARWGPRVSEAERRQLTVLFCDLVGSTELSGRLDPEEMSQVIRAYHRGCTHVIRRWDGYVAKYMGDGVLAYYGWPRAHEDDAERAVRAGLELTKAVAEQTASDGTQLAARIGIATGQVVVGELIGEGAAQEEAVVGETPNLAARLQALAAPGTVVIAASTRRLVGGVFDLDDLGAQRLKGFAEPVLGWRVVGERGAEGRFEARQTASLTPLVGREEEVALLLSRWRQARDGEGQVVLLSGEPGIGKSRLVRELRARLEGEPHIRLFYQCSPHHTTSPLHPLIEQLERAGAVERDDPPPVKLSKLETLLARGTNQLDQAVPLIAALLGIPTGGRYSLPELTPQRRKQRTLEVLVDQLDGLAGAAPVLLAYEDVHWIDPTTQELLGLAIERIRRLRVLALITFRPEFAPPWIDLPHVSSLTLTRLGRRHGVAMVEQLVREKALPDEVAAQIVAKTDGIPLFVEELTKTVLESGLLKDAGDRYELAGPLPALAIPSTLHDSLLARLDRLAPIKEVAQIGAVIGREFSRALLAAVADRREADLEVALEQLVQAELIFRRGSPPEATYSFKHALVQDAAYGTLLKSRRQHLHARIAGVLEEQFPGQARAQPELLAQHFSQAGLRQQAISYWQRAGESASARSAQAEAARHFKNALEQLEGLPEDAPRSDKELDLQIALGTALIAARGFAAAETGCAYARARVLARQHGDPARSFPVLYGQWVFHTVRAELEPAKELAEEMLRLSEEQVDRRELLIAHRMVGYVDLLLGRPASARAHLEKVLALYNPERHRSLASLYAYEPRAAALAYLPVVRLLLGYPERALRLSEEALATARQSSHLLTLCFALHARCWFHQIALDDRSLRRWAKELIELTVEHGFPYWLSYARVLHGWAHTQDASEEEGSAQMLQAFAEYQATGARLYMPYFTALLAHAGAMRGERTEELRLLTDAITRVDETGERWFEAELYRLHGEALLHLPEPDHAGAEAALSEALVRARRQGTRLWELRAATSLARLWVEQRKRAEARDLLAPVYSWFTEGFDTADLKHAKALLDALA